MPELPEVETVKNDLKQLIIGKKIIDVKVYYERMIQNVSVEGFIESLKGQKFVDIRRRGKYLIIILNDVTLLSHLRMEGKYLLRNNEPKEKHEHIIFELENNETLRYQDTRKFGVMYLFKTTNINEIIKEKPLSELGREPFDEDFNIEYLSSKFKNISRPIKTTLLDQTIICGLGNIYADEVCFMSSLNPLQITKTLTIEDDEKIIKSSITVLNKAINFGGTTIRSFKNAHEISGRFQNELLVHTKERCGVCDGPIEKVFVGGRGTYYCPNCQKIRGQLIIGITGSIATGKTAVTKVLLEEGYIVLDADSISRDALNINTTCYKEVVKIFGNTILNNDKTINRFELANIIFNDDSKKAQLENIIHPYVQKKINEKILEYKDEKMIFVVVPLLFEVRWEKMFNLIITVYCSKDNQFNRLVNRDKIDPSFAIKKINSQMDIEEKMKLSDFVINNDSDFDTLRNNINEILKKIEE